MAKTFDPKLVNITAGSSPIRGLSADSMVKIERVDPELYKFDVDSYGTLTRHKNQNNACIVTITLTQASDGNDIFSTYMQVDKQNDAALFPLTIRDGNGKSAFFSKSCFVHKSPTVDLAGENKNREWEIIASDMDIFIGGIDR